MPAVMVDDLVVRYGDLIAVDHLSFIAEAGAVTAVLGPNGAGKSSTIETLEGYRSPDGGSVRVLGLDPVAQHGELVRRIGVMLQRGGVYPGIRVGEAVALFCSYFEGSRDPRELVDRVGLSDRSRSTWKQLSGGEQQRLSLALALAGRPEVVFLDEPTASVDVAGRQLVRRIIGELAASGTAVVLTTHELDEAERVADHVVIIDRGKAVASGSPAELMRSGRSGDIRFGSITGLDVASLSRRLDAVVREITVGEYLVEAEASPSTVAALTAWLAEHDLPLADLRAGRQRLEDVFLRLTGDSDGAVRDVPSSAPQHKRRSRGRRR
ncbi:MAG: ABC transporter ATP-binding protein [Acidimicrobiia bacterium]